jgi:hypothetical protein
MAATAKFTSVPTNRPPPATVATMATAHSLGPKDETSPVNANRIVTANAEANADLLHRWIHRVR